MPSLRQVKWLVLCSSGLLAACNSDQVTNNGGCPAGQNLCGSVCATFGTDPTNCGGCGTQCALGQQCNSGRCSANCGSGTTACRAPDAGQICVDTQGDNSNCGQCGYTCPGGQVCALGHCQETCANGYAVCEVRPDGGFDAGATTDAGHDGGVFYCANVNGDPNNCGACGNVCGPGQACCGSGGEAAFTCLDVEGDSNNCGGCGHVCVGTGCNGGLCQPTRIIQAVNPGDPHVDSNNVYYLGSFSVIEAPLDGGAAINLSAGATPLPVNLTIDSANAYWADQTVDEIWQAPLDPDAGAPTFLTLFPLPPDPVPYGLATDGEALFCASGSSDGGAISIISNSFGLGGRTIASGPFVPNGLVVDSSAAGYVYWTDLDAGAVMRILRSGVNGVQTLISGQSTPTGVAVDSVNVYWANAGNGTVVAKPLDGGAAVIIAQGTSPDRVAVDSNWVFFTDSAAGTVMKIPLDGGTPLPIAIDQDSPTGICLDATHVYWTNSSNGLLGGVFAAPK